MKGKTILHGVTALCSALVYAFFALPYYSVTLAIPAAVADVAAGYGITGGTTSTSGYDFLSNALKSTSSSSTGTFAAVMALITLIVAGLAFVGAIVALLSDVKVIKNKKVAEIANWVAFATAVLLAVSCLLNLVGNVVLVGKDVKDMVDLTNAGLAQYGLAQYGAKLTASAGWALTILTTLLGLGAVGTSAYAKFKKQVKSKSLTLFK